MAGSVRHDPSEHPSGPASVGGEATDAKIEQLLLAGLDHYSNSQYERAIHVWTRVLFLDRSHARARAYIERARAALAERQRESEELLQTGVAAFDRGDVGQARELVSSALEHGVPQDEALAVLDRLSRLETASGGYLRAETPGSVGRPPRRRGAPTEHAVPRKIGWVVPTAVLLTVAAAGVYAAVAWQRFDTLPLLNRVTPSAPIVLGRQEPVPIPLAGEVALARARQLLQQEEFAASLRVLDEIRPGDPLRAQADLLRSTIQQVLLERAGRPIPHALAEEPPIQR